MYTGNNYLWWKKKLMWGTSKWAPGLAYFFYVILLPILVFTIVCSSMDLTPALICSLLGFFITSLSSIPFFLVAGMDPGINPWRRFSGNSKLWSFTSYRYKMNFYQNGFVDHGYLEYWTYCYGFKPLGTVHWLEWDQWVRKVYLHHPFFLKWIGQRNFHYYFLWLICNFIKNIYLFIVSWVGISYNVAIGLPFFFIWICAIGGDVFFIYHWGRWAFETQINPFQERRQIIKDFKNYMLTFDIPPSKYFHIRKIKTTFEGFSKRDNIVLNLSAKK